MNTDGKRNKKTLSDIEEITGGPFTLGRLLLAIRQSEEMSQVEFAELLEISKQQLCDIEHGRKSVSPQLAASYAQKLGYSEEQFIRLSLQDMLDRAGLKMVVALTLVASGHAKKRRVLRG